MDRGIPTETTLTQMRTSTTSINYLVGTPRGHLTKLEKEFLNQPWQQVRPSVQVKLLEQDNEVYILAINGPRYQKERAMRQRKLNWLWRRLKTLQRQKLTRDQLLLKLGGAKKEASRAYSVVKVRLPKTEEEMQQDGFQFTLNKEKLRDRRRHEGRYLLHSNLTNGDPV